MLPRVDITDRAEVRCPHCAGKLVVRSGRRKLVDGERQLWRCHNCGKRFSKLERGDKRTPGNVVLMGLTLWCEGYFLSCDRNTLTTEVPVWFFEKHLGATVTGHIDVLMANFGKIWVLDYKPRAAKENPRKVGTQLALYARALVFRAGIAPRDIRCAWFDDRDCFSFMPMRRV